MRIYKPRHVRTTRGFHWTSKNPGAFDLGLVDRGVEIRRVLGSWHRPFPRSCLMVKFLTFTPMAVVSFCNNDLSFQFPGVDGPFTPHFAITEMQPTQMSHKTHYVRCRAEFWAAPSC
jgi:hypothetical protein